jgi:multicomponent Na+:H+ antiporter subunit E
MSAGTRAPDAEKNMSDSPRLQPWRELLQAATWRASLVRALLLAGGWWALTEGDAAGFLFGVPLVVAATVASLALRPVPSGGSGSWRPVALLRLARVFLAGSLRGGWDVARRALSPGLPLAPALVDHAMRLPPGPAQNLFMSMLSLMPGTLSADVHGPHVAVHVLVDGGAAMRRDIDALEVHVADALGTDLADRETPHA